MSRSLSILQQAYESFFRTSAELMCIITFEGEYLEINPAWESTVGFSKTEMHLRSLLEFIHPDDREDTQCEIWQLVAGKDTIHFINRHMTKDGSYRWLQWSGSIDRDNQLFFATAHDISERRRLEQELKTERDLLREAQSLAGVGDWDFDPATNTFRMSNALCSLVFGNGLASAPGSYCSFVHPEDKLSVTKALESSARHGHDASFEHRFVAPNGRIGWLAVLLHPITDPQGQVILVRGVSQDITSRRETEIRLESERASAAASAKMATLGEMAAGIAHEINNPLAVIVGKAQQIEELATPDIAPCSRISTHASRIVAMSHRIAKIIQGLRAFARDTEHEPFDEKTLLSIVEDTVDLCRARFQNHSVKLRIEPIPEDLLLHCRAVQISQVILNLLNNAFDAIYQTPSPWVEVSYKDLGDSVELHVTDSGGGISPDVASKIMLPFFTTKDVGKGTGLGLSISKGIAENHGGSLELDPSSPNTRFTLRLPKRTAAIRSAAS